jgi:hypothetical protein
MKVRLIILFLVAVISVQGQKPAKPTPPVVSDQTGKLVYTQDERGNRVPDFSYCGFYKSEQPIPDIPVKIFVPLKDGDATSRIQSAIDYVASLPVDGNGFRGTVLLAKGTYEVSGGLVIKSSGIVLRGSGNDENGTRILATGQDRETLIRLYGKDDRQFSEPFNISDETVPVNSMEIHVVNSTLKPGDQVRISRPSTKEWIDATGTEYFGGGISALGWKPGNQDINWERTVLKVTGDDVVLDVPLTNELDGKYGISQVCVQKWPGRISCCGVENLLLESAWDKANAKDENHRWMAITLENIENAWVRRVTFRHFAGSAVYTLETAKQVTVEDCKSYAPVSEIGGYRRNTFYNEGQMNLFQRLYAEYGFHDFAVGQCAAGPNAFVQCHSFHPYGFSGATGSWASGVLFDLMNVEGNALSFANRGQDGQGAGWSAANSVFWQCKAALIICPKPPTAQNWAFASWSQFQGDGSWTSSNQDLQPRSLFYGQLTNRLGKNAIDGHLMPVYGESTSSPDYELAKEMSEMAKKPALQLKDWIDSVIAVNPLSNKNTGIKTSDDLKIAKTDEIINAKGLEIKNGWITNDDQVLTGSRRRVEWWRGNLKPAYLFGEARMHLTRYVPGRSGRGLTDDIKVVADKMKEEGIVALDHNYGLWYDRRRDDHERVFRMDGDVWAPFYEQPFARSGQGTAFDGLSKYDLTKWNYWYWNRLKTFADLADRKGLVLFHHNFFQHNIIEAGAHWTDCPWRTANNINNTGFPEPVNYAGDECNYMAEQFYDLKNPERKELQRNYIRKCLDNFSGNTNVIQFIGFEFTGPLHFVEFWLDVIGEWEKETGKNVIVALGVTKDVQDAILADPVRSKLVEIIDTKAWNYLPDGKMYAPGGGHNIAPRQYDRLRKKGIDQETGNPPSEKAKKAGKPDDLIYWAVRDYRDAYPEKAVLYSSETAGVGWPAFMAGGSICSLPAGLPVGFLKSAIDMNPVDMPDAENCWVLGNLDKGFIAYVKYGSKIRIDLGKAKGVFKAQLLDTATGKAIGGVMKVSAGKEFVFNVSDGQKAVLWLYR